MNYTQWCQYQDISISTHPLITSVVQTKLQKKVENQQKSNNMISEILKSKFNGKTYCSESSSSSQHFHPSHPKCRPQHRTLWRNIAARCARLKSSTNEVAYIRPSIHTRGASSYTGWTIICSGLLLFAYLLHSCLLLSFIEFCTLIGEWLTAPCWNVPVHMHAP